MKPISPQSVGNLLRLHVQLTGACKVAQHHHHRVEVGHGRDLLVRVGGSRDLDRALDVGDAAGVASDDSRAAHRVQVSGARSLEAELLRDPERFAGHLDRAVEVLRHHQDPTELLKDEGLLGRGAALVDELPRMLQVLQRRVLIAAEHPDRPEPRLRLGRRLHLSGAQQLVPRLLEDRVVHGLVLDPAAPVGEQEFRTLVVVLGPELQGGAEEALGHGVGAERERTIAGVACRAPGPFPELLVRLRPGLAP